MNIDMLNDNSFGKKKGSRALDEILVLAEMEFQDILNNELNLQTFGRENPSFASLVFNPFIEDELYLYPFEKTVLHVIEAVACDYIHEGHYHCAGECSGSQHSDMEIEYDPHERSFIFGNSLTLMYQVGKRELSYTINVKFDNRAFQQEAACQRLIQSIEEVTYNELKRMKENENN
ncbi:hypothetical protein ACTHPW_18995 [Bacillus velezensis]|uniref:hypothetical protein n=1 Tax=Bacillus velezensis TaxID=492670 RepID=UPI003F7CB9C6